MHKILIVDDSATIRSELNALLTESGYLAVEAEDGEDGLDKARTESPDLIICDLNMPNMDGLSMCTHLRKQENEGQHTPIFILTTQTSEHLKLEGKEIGITAWIIKPYKKASLLKALNKVLNP